MTATSKPWLPHYQPGVPANIDASVYPSLVELLEPWSVRERFILVRKRDALPHYAEALIETLCAHYRNGVMDDRAPTTVA